ncbi:hypothetical protein R1sor_019792 [Riccia sorocarpa]|uniref:Uncharacterized protein n=1 Tax=Riccia sorocarpa TaxID=122646 RepID=A0ABD3IH59_9MARC
MITIEQAHESEFTPNGVAEPAITSVMQGPEQHVPEMQDLVDASMLEDPGSDVADAAEGADDFYASDSDIVEMVKKTLIWMTWTCRMFSVQIGKHRLTHWWLFDIIQMQVSILVSENV